MVWKKIPKILLCAIDDKGRISFYKSIREILNIYPYVEFSLNDEMNLLGMNFSKTCGELSYEVYWNREGRHLSVPAHVYYLAGTRRVNILKNKYELNYNSDDNIWFINFNKPLKKK